MNISFVSSDSANIVKKTIKNVGFYPDIKMSEFQNLYRVPAEFNGDIIEHQLTLAISSVNQSLVSWQEDQEAEGHEKLEDVPAPRVNDANVCVQNYKRAVFCKCKASILKEYETVSRQAVAENTTKTGKETSEWYIELSNQAIKRVMMLPKIGVYII